MLILQHLKVIMMWDDDGDEIELFKYELDGGCRKFHLSKLKDLLELETSRKQVIIDHLKN